MFIDPIISDQNISKEVSAVDSEFNMHFNESEFLWDMVNKYLAKNHPASGFDCGNKKTLFENITDKNLLRDIIILFRSYYYNARDAALVITSPLEYDKLKEIIESKFSLLPNFDSETHLKQFMDKYQNTK